MSQQQDPSASQPAGQYDGDGRHKISGEQLIALQAQIDRCQYQKKQLTRSRNSAILVTLVALLVVFYLIFIQPPEDLSGQQQALIARQLAAHKKQLTEEHCLATTVTSPALAPDESISEDAESTIKRIEGRLHEQQADPLHDDTVERVSGVLDRLSPRPLADPVSQWREKQAISRTLYLWAVAWELKDLPAYFSYYARNFDPQTSDTDLEAWKARRTYLINKPSSIRITLNDINIRQLDSNSATVVFNQHYQTPEYSDHTKKLIDLVKENNQWRILRETSTATKVDLKLKP